MADLTAWRALVAKELAGASFDKLVQRTPEGIAIDPLYVERPAEAPFVRDPSTEPWKLCVRVQPGDDVLAEIEGGADAVWCGSNDQAAIEAARSRGAIVVIDGAPNLVSTLAFHDAGADAADE